MTDVNDPLKYFAVKHVTDFAYSEPVSESITEVYMHPRSDGGQRCLNFKLTTIPRAAITAFSDHNENTVHYFDIAAPHSTLRVTAEALMEMHALPVLPASLEPDHWQELDRLTTAHDFWTTLTPSPRTPITQQVERFALQIDAQRRADPLTFLRELNTAIYESFEYIPNSTAVDSPIDDALSARSGVCQDFSHVMIALARRVGIPCRYVSGYLYYRHASDRSTPDATHAWVEAYLPTLGWIGFDPTNNILAEERHIRVAVGRDYDDVPPTRGMFKGTVETQLHVEVHITQVSAPVPDQQFAAPSGWQPDVDEAYSRQQQQQQQ